MTMTYIAAIGINWTTVQCHTVGDTNQYEDLVWDAGDAIPPQETLDAWIASTPEGTRRITVLAFRNRFTSNEKVSMEMASLDNPAAATNTRLLAASLRATSKDLEVATYVDLDRADTRNGVISLETYGILGVGRALEILDAPVQAIELPK